MLFRPTNVSRAAINNYKTVRLQEVINSKAIDRGEEPNKPANGQSTQNSPIFRHVSSRRQQMDIVFSSTKSCSISKFQT
jgi:hypothetical protein